MGGVIGRNWLNHHVEAHKLARRKKEIVINVEKVRQTKFSMMMSLSTVGEDGYYLNDYYEGVKRLFDLREPYMAREYAVKIIYFSKLFKIFVNSNVCYFIQNI